MSIVCFDWSFAEEVINQELLFGNKQSKVYKSFDIHKDPFGLHHVVNEMEEAAKTGASWIRIAIFWFNVEPVKGRYRTDNLIKGLNIAASEGFEVVPRIISVNPWGNTNRINELNRDSDRKGKPMGNYTYIGYPSDVKAYKEFLTHLVERYDGDGVDDVPGLKRPIKYWQIENEWDWRWKDSPEKFVEFLKIAYTTIKEADPESTVILGGIADIMKLAFADGYLGQSVTVKNKVIRPEDLKDRKNLMNQYAFIKSVLINGRGYFDVIDFHHYGHYELIEGSVEWLKDIMMKSGYEKPIWIMEGGGPFENKGEVYTEEKHAQEIIKYYVTALGSGVEVFFWSSYLPTEGWNRSFLNTSIVSSGKKKKSAYYSYQLMTSKLKGSTKVEKLSPDDNLYAFKFIKKDKSYLYVLWANTKREIKIRPVDRELLVTDYLGRKTNLKKENNMFIVPVDNTPIFMEFY